MGQCRLLQLRAAARSSSSTNWENTSTLWPSSISGSSCSSSASVLALGALEFGLMQPRVAANLPQAQQRRQEMKLLLGQFLLRFNAQQAIAARA